MSSPVELVLSRLETHRLRPNGRDRWRACCPAHGGSNPSALSIGIGQDDSVLLKCWHGCSIDQVAHALGLDLHELFPSKPTAGAPPMRRRRLLTASQALDLLTEEIALARHCSEEMAAGEVLDAQTRERLLLSAARVTLLSNEVRA